MAVKHTPIPERSELIDGKFLSRTWFQFFYKIFDDIYSRLSTATSSGGSDVVVNDSQNIANGSNILVTSNTAKQIVRIQGSGGAVTLSNTPFGGSHGLEDGQEVHIEFLSDTNTVTINPHDSSHGVALNGIFVGTKYCTLALRWNATFSRFLVIGMNYG